MLSSSTATSESEPLDKGAERRKIVLSGLVENYWVWIGAFIMFACAGWVTYHAGKLSGTASFYVGLFVVLAALLLWYGIRDIRGRLRRLEYVT